MPNHPCYLHNNVVAQIVQFDNNCCSGNINLEKHAGLASHSKNTFVILSLLQGFYSSNTKDH